MKRAVVTGASGFVGANLVRRLLDDGHEVHVLLRTEFKSWRLEEIHDRTGIHHVDITSIDALESVMRSIRPDWIFHLAAHGAYPTQTDLDQMMRTNVLGTAALLSAALKVGFEAFLNTGSSSEYGLKDHAPAESEWLEPNSDYAVTKASATLLCSHVGRSTGAGIGTLRLYSVYGPWEEPSRLIPSLALRGLDGGLPQLAQPTTARDFIYVDDVLDAFVLAAEHVATDPGVVYNVGTGIQLTLAEVVGVASEQLGIDVQPTWGTMGNRSWDTNVWVSDSGRLRSLGWSPKVPFERGFAEFVRWVASDEDRLAYYRLHAAK